MAAAFALLYTEARVDFSPLASSITGTAGTVILWGVLCAIVLWLAVDARPAIALVIALELAVAPGLVFEAMAEARWSPRVSSCSRWCPSPPARLP